MAWLALVSGLIKLATVLTSWAHDRGLIDQGRRDAIATAHEAAAASLRTAQAAAAAAEAAHAADPTDGAFDPTFKRSD